MICVLVGESASGKSTIEKEMMKKYNYTKVVTYTTRPMRKGEVDGVDYHFITGDKFEEMIKENKFVEHTMYRDWHYGICLDESMLKSNEKHVTVMTLKGLKTVKNALGSNGIADFYISVPDKIRMKRLLNRGDEAQEIARRILADKEDFKGAEQECSYIVNNSTENAILTNSRIINSICSSVGLV